MKAKPEPTLPSARSWMRQALREDDGALVDRKTGEANLTALAEAAADAFDCDHWLDDPEHFVWDAALAAADAEGCGVRA